MALNDNAVVTAARGYIFFGTVGAAAPTPTAIDTFVPGGTFAGFTEVGHTSREDLPEFGFDGGDTETKGSWQNESLKSVVTAASVDYVTMNLLQFDEQTLELYYGVANGSATVGEFEVTNASTTPPEKALLIVVSDGATNIGFYARRAAIRREEAITMATDDFVTFPIRATFLKDGSNGLFRWISIDTGVNPS